MFGHASISLNTPIDTPLQSHHRTPTPIEQLTFQPFWEAQGASSVNKGKINFGMEVHTQSTLNEKEG